MCKASQPRRQGDLGLLRGVVMDTEGFQPYSTMGISLMNYCKHYFYFYISLCRNSEIPFLLTLVLSDVALLQLTFALWDLKYLHYFIPRPSKYPFILGLPGRFDQVLSASSSLV